MLKKFIHFQLLQKHMGITIEKTGTIELKHLSDTKTTDVYRVQFTGEDAPPNTKAYEQHANGMTIGCPSCKENTFAFFRDGDYHCLICSYSDSFTETDITQGYVKYKTEA